MLIVSLYIVRNALMYTGAWGHDVWDLPGNTKISLQSKSKEKNAKGYMKQAGKDGTSKYDTWIWGRAHDTTLYM